jgi:hypothetical protein
MILPESGVVIVQTGSAARFIEMTPERIVVTPARRRVRPTSTHPYRQPARPRSSFSGCGAVARHGASPVTRTSRKKFVTGWPERP